MPSAASWRPHDRLRDIARSHAGPCKGSRMSALLELRGVTRIFQVSQGLFARKRALRAVDGVDLDVASGDVLGIVGESGCGKSTVARIMLGLLPPSSGTMQLDGRDVADIPRREFA